MFAALSFRVPPSHTQFFQVYFILVSLPKPLRISYLSHVSDMPRSPATPVVLHSKEPFQPAVLQHIFHETYEQDLVPNTSLCTLILQQVLFITARVLLSENERSRNN